MDRDQARWGAVHIAKALQHSMAFRAADAQEPVSDATPGAGNEKNSL